VRDLNLVYQQEAALWDADFTPAGFSWIDCNDHEQSIVSLMRRTAAGDGNLIAIVNFTPVPRHGYRVGVPVNGSYEELLNSDAGIYGGSNIGNQGRVAADAIAEHGQPFSLSLTVPPLGFVLLKPNK
jgi:1,4-alpha-glucan branching enzyme